MDKKYIIYIGIGILAYYLWKKSKNKQEETIDVEVEDVTNDEPSVPTKPYIHDNSKYNSGSNTNTTYEEERKQFSFDSLLGDIN
jgi:hypothetical protein